MTTIRTAGLNDESAIEAFLTKRIATSMFPLTNLRTYGLNGTAPRAMRFWVSDHTPIEGVLGITNEGMLMPQSDKLDWESFAKACQGEHTIGAIGPALQVRSALRAFGLEGAKTRLDSDEPGFTLDLDQLVIPDLHGARLDPATQADSFLVSWRAAYHQEVLGTPADEAEEKAAADVSAYLAQNSHRVLRFQGKPVAFTGFNATLPEIVQIGGVYVPPDLRGQGYARLAVALHLHEARQNGVPRACLFAFSEAAARAYRAIGFQPAEAMALVLFDQKETVK